MVKPKRFFFLLWFVPESFFLGTILSALLSRKEPFKVKLYAKIICQKNTRRLLKTSKLRVLIFKISNTEYFFFIFNIIRKNCYITFLFFFPEAIKKVSGTIDFLFFLGTILSDKNIMLLVVYFLLSKKTKEKIIFSLKESFFCILSFRIFKLEFLQLFNF